MSRKLQMEWISVEDRLPDMDYMPVLVAVCPPSQTNETHYAYIFKGRWNVLDEDGNHADFITHWMPLPEPPEGKDE